MNDLPVPLGCWQLDANGQVLCGPANGTYLAAPGLQLVALPQYSPDRDPGEAMWDWIRVELFVQTYSVAFALDWSGNTDLIEPVAPGRSTDGCRKEVAFCSAFQAKQDP